MIPLRRALQVIRPLSYAELAAKLPQEERYLTRILVRRADAEDFGPLPAGEAVNVGDDVLLYAIDKTDVEQLGAVNKEFDRHYYPPQTGINPDEAALIRTRLPARGAKVLELCCGAGRITGHLRREGNRVTGLDFNRHCLAAARRRDGDRIHYVLGDATNLPFADETFDVTCCLENGFGVLFSLAAAALAQMIRVTREGGRVIVGLREQEGRPDHFHLYHTQNGLVNVAQTFDRDSVSELLASLPASAAARVGWREEIAGAPRPWGGRTFYTELRVA